MASIVIGSKIFGDMFGQAEMRALFSDESTVQLYLDVEAALARAQASCGIIPAAAARAITEYARVENIDWDKLSQRAQIVGYPILPLVEQLSQGVAGGHGQWCHWGATTQDIMDSADVLQIRLALDRVSADLDAIATALAKLAEEHAELAMAGRTHLQHALPISFGYKAATWLSGIDRHRARLQELRPRVEVVSFAGAAGTLASLGVDDGLKTQVALARELELGEADITWHSIRDNFAEVSGFLALVAGSIGKIGYDIMLLMQTEVSEVLEPFVTGRGASSTMPQKRNPIASEMMLATAKIVREQHSAMLDAMVQDHERATGQWQVEWQALPTAFIMASAGLGAARETLEGLEIRPQAMRDNLNASGGLIVAEAVMMELGKHLGRQAAHDIVYDCCRQALNGDMSLLDALTAEPRVSSIMNREQISELVNPANYLGCAPQMTRNFLQRRAKGY